MEIRELYVIILDMLDLQCVASTSNWLFNHYRQGDNSEDRYPSPYDE